MAAETNQLVYETIILPTERLARGFDTQVRIADIVAWPGQTLLLDFAYNPQMSGGRWVWTASHHRSGTADAPTRIVPRSVVQMGPSRTYRAGDYLRFFFYPPEKDPSTIDVITPALLGGDVKLYVAPGPSGGSFLPAAGLSQAEEDALLGRTDTVESS